MALRDPVLKRIRGRPLPLRRQLGAKLGDRRDLVGEIAGQAGRVVARVAELSEVHRDDPRSARRAPEATERRDGIVGPLVVQRGHAQARRVVTENPPYLAQGSRRRRRHLHVVTSSVAHGAQLAEGPTGVGTRSSNLKRTHSTVERVSSAC